MSGRQERLLHTDLQVRLQMQFAERFDSSKLIAERKLLAARLIARAPHDNIQETVMDFFEDLGVFLGRQLVDDKLAHHNFGFYGLRWWKCCSAYVLEERKRKNDPTLFANFENLSKLFLQLDVERNLPEPTLAQIETFLREEINLP
jgi:hypothetical protein